MAKADFGSKVIGYISKFYIWMIIGVIGGMVLHNLIVFRKKLILHRIGQPRILFRMTQGTACAAYRPARQLLHPGADGLCLALSVIVAGRLCSSMKRCAVSSTELPEWC